MSDEDPEERRGAPWDSEPEPESSLWNGPPRELDSSAWSEEGPDRSDADPPPWSQAPPQRDRPEDTPALITSTPGPAALQLTEPRRPKRRTWLVNTLELVVIVIIALLVAYEVQAHVVKPYRIPSGSMIPTLEIGQRILVNRLDTHPKLGDVVVFHPPVGADNDEDPQCGDPDAGLDHQKPCDKPLPVESSETFVKRIVGLPGDRLSIKNGIVYRNGTPEKLPYTATAAGLASGYVSCASGGPVCTFPDAITVPAGDYYMMGDNRGNSLDSRYWGPVPQKWIIGVAFFTYWPIDRIGTL